MPTRAAAMAAAPVPEITAMAPVQQRELQLVPGTFDAEKRTVDAVFTTGARRAMIRWKGWDAEWVDEELSTDPKNVRMERINSGAPVLNAHRSWSLGDQIGVVIPGTGRMEKGKGVAQLQLSEREELKGLMGDIAAGIIRNISVGYVVHRYEITEKQGERPLYRAVDWEPHEISFVPIPADAGAGVRSAETEQGGFPCILRRDAAHIMEARMAENENPGGAAPAPAVVTPPAQQRAPDTPPTPPTDQVTAVDLDKFVRDAKLPADFALEMIRENAATPMTRAAALEKVLAKRAAQDAPPINGRHSGQITITQDQRDKTIRGIENSIILRSGLAALFVEAAKTDRFQREHKLDGARIDLDPGEFRGVRMANLARAALERSGVVVRSFNEAEIVGQALVVRDGGMNTTGDFAVALENVMHKTLQAAYLTQPDTWSKFCGTGSVTDFRAHNRYLRGSFGRLDALNEHGELKNKSIPDAAKETIKATTFGNIVGLTRQAIINDDLSIFDSVAQDLGRAAKLSIESDVFTALLSNSGLGPTMNDTQTMIHATHANIGTSAAPTVDSFDEAAQLMASQKDISGKEFLDIRPAIWLGSLAKRGAAMVVNASKYDPDAANKLERPNKAFGTFREIIGTPRLTGNPWWAFADPMQAPAIEVAFLNGEDMPKQDSKDGWRMDGIEWRIVFDYGVGALNWRSVVRNAGG